MELECQNGLLEYIWKAESFATAIIDNEAGIQQCNEGFLRLFAILPQEYSKRSIYKLIKSKELKEKLVRVIDIGQKRSEFVFSYSIYSENICWSRVEAFRLDEVPSYLLLFQDLTEAYQAQMIMEAHSMVSDDIFIFFDHSDHILHCSEKAAQVFGFSSGREARGVHYSTLMHGKASIKEVEEAFYKLHNQEGYLGYLSLQQQGSHNFYELSGFHVNLRNVSVGVVLLLKALPPSSYHSIAPIEKNEFLRESEGSDSAYRSHHFTYSDTASLFWNSKDCKERLQELHKALERYEYIEINKLLERIIMLAPKESCEVLQNIQNAIMSFEYERALSIFKESQLII